MNSNEEVKEYFNKRIKELSKDDIQQYNGKRNPGKHVGG